jgi:hypothetical protein
MLNYKTRVITYDTNRYPFAALVRGHFRKDLALLHEGAPAIARLEVGKDTATPMHEWFYRGDETGSFNRLFLSIYHQFMREFAGPGAYLYQKVPSFRVHLPGNVATGNFHRDSDFGHQEEELNILVALTPMAGENSVWVESERGRGDYSPVTMDVGQALVFHGAVLSHGSLTNTTGKTRVSFDARILPRASYRPGGTTINQGVPFAIGGYWEAL